MTTLTPTLFWAQRADKLWITLDVQDCASPSITFDNEIKPEECKIRAGPRKIEPGGVPGCGPTTGGRA
eukprot:jgi/Tetstr1/444491/TSEL_032372.t1